ncbi:hypothetical protein [Pseudotamlana carrageenivorans]|uniref:Outer membrane protein beta-barrel domain-containing protein n=1 Tax=Pseudotamlana carrageenivorans TaxID=2069432 RepID=A0A2I7SKL5_9FLAO|nr:hypothetical protein [Tamlana carrageenivorans]AUS06420.1 hypothetical protein C1A40_13635 [Tamlana carrageenivorans]
MEKTKWGMYMWGIGGALTIPTATSKYTGSGKFSAGPSGMLIGFTKKTTIGLVFMQTWSFAGNAHRQDVNTSMLQILYFFQIGNGWQLGDNPSWIFNWNMPNKNKVSMPIGFGVFKTTHIGNSLFRIGLTPRYYIMSRKIWGDKFGLSLTLTPVLNNPYKKNMPHMSNM